MAESKKINFNHHFNNGPIRIRAVPDQLEIVFNSLIENAVKYSFTGFEDKPTFIDIAYGCDDEYLEIIIESLGCYITSEEIIEGRIFELGYRGRYSSDRSRKGTGSGLHIAKRIVTAHNALISVHSVLTNTNDPHSAAINKFVVSWPLVN